MVGTGTGVEACQSQSAAADLPFWVTVVVSRAFPFTVNGAVTPANTARGTLSVTVAPVGRMGVPTVPVDGKVTAIRALTCWVPSAERHE